MFTLRTQYINDSRCFLCRSVNLGSMVTRYACRCRSSLMIRFIERCETPNVLANFRVPSQGFRLRRSFTLNVSHFLYGYFLVCQVAFLNIFCLFFCIWLAIVALYSS